MRYIAPARPARAASPRTTTPAIAGWLGAKALAQKRSDL